MTDNLSADIIASANRLQVNPVDLATAISYETAGTFDPWKRGPTTQWGQHRGLIQWGEPQRAKYGVYQGMSNADQMGAVERYLTDAGVRPGMGLKDIYSAINAGHVGRYNASDANNGGAPGTVLDKVNYQMGPHRAKAEQLLAGQYTPAASPQQPAAQPQSVASLYGAQDQPQGNPDPLAAQQPAVMPGDTSLGSLALLFSQQMKQKQDQQEADAQAEATRRAALFSQTPFPGVAPLYG